MISLCNYKRGFYYILSYSIAIVLDFEYYCLVSWYNNLPVNKIGFHHMHKNHLFVYCTAIGKSYVIIHCAIYIWCAFHNFNTEIIFCWAFFTKVVIFMSIICQSFYKFIKFINSNICTSFLNLIFTHMQNCHEIEKNFLFGKKRSIKSYITYVHCTVHVQYINMNMYCTCTCT